MRAVHTAPQQRLLIKRLMDDGIWGLLAAGDADAIDNVAGFFDQNSWQVASGHIHSKRSSWLLIFRSLDAMTSEDDDESREALNVWLPPVSELLRIVEFEIAFRSQPFGSCHPALLCAQLHGERLGAWDVTDAVASRLLEVEEFNPLCRVEAGRLLCRARASLGRREGACEAASRAADEAARTGCRWLEMLALRDWLRYGGDGVDDLVWARLDGVMGQLVSSREELMSVLGEDIRHRREARAGGQR
jgi:hypothetical protein